MAEKYDNPSIPEDIEDTHKIKLWFMFEVQAVGEQVALNAMKKHLTALSKEENVVIEKYLIEEPEPIEAPENLKQKGVEEVHSVIAEAIVYVKDLDSAINVMLNYAPSAIEVLKPDKYEISLQDLQNTLTSISDFMHKLLSQGLGGVVLKL